MTSDVVAMRISARQLAASLPCHRDVREAILVKARFTQIWHSYRSLPFRVQLWVGFVLIPVNALPLSVLPTWSGRAGAGRIVCGSDQRADHVGRRWHEPSDVVAGSAGLDSAGDRPVVARIRCSRQPTAVSDRTSAGERAAARQRHLAGIRRDRLAALAERGNATYPEVR